MRAKSKGLLVYAETLAAALGSDGTKLWDKDWDVAARYVNSPCLSPDPKTKTQIMKYINNGVIDVVGTDIDLTKFLMASTVSKTDLQSSGRRVLHRVF